ncbi:polysaccharide biosynthesis C-terminal domain-containing protein [Patescibacteria group bacterium]|nr:polysaccharide biosynthesis C-terminal domain-containing protein [Patescibacteria group bacterium]
MSKQKDLIKNTIIIAFGKLSTQFLTFLLLPLYTSYLTTSEFGTVDLAMTYIGLLAPLIMVALEMAAFRFLIDARDIEKEKIRVITNVLQMVGLFAVIALLLFAVVSRFVAVPFGWLMPGVVLAIIASNMLLQFARGFGDNVKYSIGGVVAGVTTIAANILFIVYMGMGAEGMLFGVLIGNLAVAAYLFVVLKVHRFIILSASDKSLKLKLLRYSAPLVPNGMSWWAINAADRTVVAIVLGVASNGIYAVAYKFPMIFNGLFSFFGMSWTESASMNIEKRDRDEFFSQTMNASIRLFGSLGLCIIAGVSLVFTLLVSQTYHEAYMYIPLLIVGSFFNSIVSLYGAIYIAKKMTKQVMNSSIIAAFISILLTVCLISQIGLFAPALAMVAAYGSMAVYRHHDVKKFVNITYDYKSFTILALAFVAVATLYYINSPLLNILNVLVALGISVILNRSIISIIKTKLFARLRPLTPEQQILEDIEEKKL